MEEHKLERLEIKDELEQPDFNHLGFVFFKLDKKLEKDDLNQQLKIVNKHLHDGFPRVFASLHPSPSNFMTEDDHVSVSKKLAQIRVNQVYFHLIQHQMYPPGTDFMLICDRKTDHYLRDLYLFVSFVANIQNHFKIKTLGKITVDIRSTVLIGFENLALPEDGKQRYWFLANNQDYEYIFPEYVQDFHTAFRFSPHRLAHEWRFSFPQIPNDYWKNEYIQRKNDNTFEIQTLVYPNIGIRAACSWERLPSLSLDPKGIDYLKSSKDCEQLLMITNLVRPISSLIRQDTIFAHLAEYFDLLNDFAKKQSQPYHYEDHFAHLSLSTNTQSFFTPQLITVQLPIEYFDPSKFPIVEKSHENVQEQKKGIW